MPLEFELVIAVFEANYFKNCKFYFWFKKMSTEFLRAGKKYFLIDVFAKQYFSQKLNNSN